MKLLDEMQEKREPISTPVKQYAKGQKDKEADEDCVMKMETSIDSSKTAESQQDLGCTVKRVKFFGCLILPFFIVWALAILFSEICKYDDTWRVCKLDPDGAGLVDNEPSTD